MVCQSHKYMKQHYARILSLLEKCCTMMELKQIHVFMIKTSLDKNTIPVSKLIDFCTASEMQDFEYARSIFLLLRKPSVYMWNSMIRGYTNSEKSQRESLRLYGKMLEKGYSPDHFTFPFVLKACSIVRNLSYGRSVHSYISKTGFEVNTYVSTCLLHLYLFCGDSDSGWKVFNGIPKPNVVAWTSLISGLVNNNQCREAIVAFQNARQQCSDPNEMTMANVLVACGKSKDLGAGKQVHALVQKQGFGPFTSETDFNEILATTIMDMYVKCGCLETAVYMFDEMPYRSLISWNCIISGYNQSGHGGEALSLFHEMQVSGIMPDKTTFLCVIPSCTKKSSLSSGQKIHACVFKFGFMDNTAVATALGDMYAKNGDLDSAKKIFGQLKNKDLMAWTSFLIGLATHGHGKEALSTFRSMKEDGDLVPDEITYIAVLYACSHEGLIEQGEKHFLEMKKLYGMEPWMEHCVCMVDLLSRAGQLVEAEKLALTTQRELDPTVCSALINGCAIHQDMDLVERLKERMRKMENIGSGIYVLLSNVYARAGLWEEVKLTRELMNQKRVSKVNGHSLVKL